MSELKILLVVGFVIFQIIRFFSKNVAGKKAKNPNAAPSTIEEMIEKMNQQGHQKNEKPKQIIQKQRAPIITSEINEDLFEQKTKKKTKEKVLVNQSINTEDYEINSPVISNMDKAPFEEFVTKKETNKYLEKMQNPQSFRDAFIMNEILNPKYV